MDFSANYGDKAERFREEVRDWIDNIKVPPEVEFAPGAPSFDELDDKTYAFAKELQFKLAAKGWLYPAWPKEYGGGGLSLEEKFVIDEELLRRGLPEVHDPGKLLGAALLTMGSERQRKKFLPLIAKGEIAVWQAFTEPEAGSDLASLQLQAVHDKDDFILNGQKTFIGGLQHVDYLFTLGVTDPEAPRRQNISTFVVRADSPGISMTPLQPMGRNRKNTIYFKDVRVPAENLIGELNRGWDVANLALQAERQAWGQWFRLDQLFERFLHYCRETNRDGVPLIEDPRVQQLLTGLYLDVKTSNLMDARRKWMLLRNIPITYEVALHALNMKTLSPRFASVLLDIAGPQALVTDEGLAILSGEVEHFQRDSLGTHGGGTPEIQKLTIARAMGLPSPRRR